MVEEPKKQRPKTLKDIDSAYRFDSWWLEQQDPNWVVVAEGIDKENESYYGTSWLTPATDESIDAALNKIDWDSHIGEGLPGFGQKGYDGAVIYLPKDVSPNRPEPFVIWREFQGLFPKDIEIIQEFTLYHNLYLKSPDFIDPISEEVIVSKQISENTRVVKVKRSSLRDFLAARKQLLVRGFDNRKHLKTDRVPDINCHFKSDTSFFHLYVGSDTSIRERTNTLCMIHGRYIVCPYKEPKHESYQYLAHPSREKKKVSLIVGADDDGNEIVANSLADSEYLTHVFFKGDVLQKYYNSPRLYKVEANMIRYLHQWSIEYGKNTQGVIHAWLGDIWRDLPFEEQLHWRSYNIPPTGGVEEVFVRRQIDAEFADSERLEQTTLDTRELLDKAWNTHFGFILFEPLPHHEQYIYSSFHTPINNEWKEFSEQIGFLTKLFVESINLKALRENIKDKNKLKDPEGNKLGSLATFEVFCEERNLGEPARAFAKSLRVLQSVRSKCSAHSVSLDSLNSHFSKLGLDPNLKLQETFADLVSQLRETSDALLTKVTTGI